VYFLFCFFSYLSHALSLWLYRYIELLFSSYALWHHSLCIYFSSHHISGLAVYQVSIHIIGPSSDAVSAGVCESLYDLRIQYLTDRSASLYELSFLHANQGYDCPSCRVGGWLEKMSLLMSRVLFMKPFGCKLSATVRFGKSFFTFF